MRGYIRKRGKSWTIVIELPRDPVTGKRRQKWVTVRGTRRDAERKLAELSPMTVQEAVTKMLSEKKPKTVSDCLLRQGMHPKVVQERLGHKSIKTTLGINSHVLSVTQKEAVRVVERAFRGSRQQR